MAKCVVKKSRRQRARLPDAAHIVYSGVWKIATIAGGTLIALYTSYVAWTGLGFWQPAGIAYVDGHIEQAVKPIASKVDEQGASILSGRIETLKSSRQQQIDAKSRLDLQSHTTKDAIAIQLIGQQQKSIDDTIKGIDGQIATLSAQLQAKQ